MHVAIYANDCGMSQRAEVFYRALFVDILDDIRFNTRSSPALVEPAEMPDNALCKPRLSGRSASFAHERRSEQSAEEKSSKKSPSLRQQILRRRKNWNYALPVRYKYVVESGNNSRAVLAAFRRRPWWGPARKGENESMGSSKACHSRSHTADHFVPGTNKGYGQGFSLWWRMYISKTVIETSNQDPATQQAVNHFEFNYTLVSKKGLLKSLQAFCSEGKGVIPIDDIIPRTFYLACTVQGSMKATVAVPDDGSSDDDRQAFFAFCATMGIVVRRSVEGAVKTKCTRLLSPPPNQNPVPTPSRHAWHEDGHSHRGEVSQGRDADENQGSMPEISDTARVQHSDASLEVPTRRGSIVGDNAMGGKSWVSRLTSSPSQGLVGDAATANVSRCDEEPPSKITHGNDTSGAPAWVVKPAANSNCGFGIQLCCSVKEVLEVVDDPRRRRGGCSGWIVQRYIEHPLLVRGRKFDIRTFVLLVADPKTRAWRRRSLAAAASQGVTPGGDEACQGGEITKGRRGTTVITPQDAKSEPPAGHASNGVVEPCPLIAWCHRDAYVRLSSVQYSNNPSKVKDRFVHLTNDAVQRRSPSYGHEEPGNKMTLGELQAWLDENGSPWKGRARGWVEGELRPRMHTLVATSVAAAAAAGINRRGRPHAFELLGYDFMVDEQLKVWLIEVNSNPCLEFVCPVLEEIITRVIDDTFTVAVDPVFRPPERHRAMGLGGTAAKPGVAAKACGFQKVYPSPI